MEVGHRLLVMRPLWISVFKVTEQQTFFFRQTHHQLSFPRTVECQDFDTYDLVDSSRNYCHSMFLKRSNQVKTNGETAAGSDDYEMKWRKLRIFVIWHDFWKSFI